jgi:hypothetical protein
MAERRMFAKTIVLSDAFLDMPLSARCLYFTLGMFADDDGFVNSPKGIMRQCGASEDDMKVLITKKFVLNFESGVIVIKHWRINNYLRNDRYQETKYLEEKSELITDENGAYTFGIPNIGIPSIGKDSIEEDSIGKVSKGKKTPTVYYPADDLLNQAFTDYVEMRKKLKSPMTERAIQLAMGNLEKLSGGDNDIAVQILEQSVMNSWKGLFALKEDKRSNNAGGIDWSKV